MTKKLFLLLTLFCVLSINPLGLSTQAGYTATPPLPVQAPILKWQQAGCYATWCETGWYSSPAVGDLDGDGEPEVLCSGYSIFSLDGSTGAVEWQVKSGYDRTTDPGTVENVGRTWPGIVLADIDGDDQLEIATAHGGGYVSVYNAQGYFETGWWKQPVTMEPRGLAVSDLDGDGSMEVIVTAAVFSETNTWVYEHDGALRSGWPQLDNDSGYAWGVFNDNAAVGDLDGDGQGEIVVPSDNHYICAYESNGVQIPANSIYGDKAWGAVGVFESLATELRGWGLCEPEEGREERYRPAFTYGPSVIADVNGDGITEVVVVGNMNDCVDYSSKYIAPFIFNADRSRFNDGIYNWENTPIDTGAPLSEDYNVIETNQPNPVVADLDGDGELEILFSSYDGRVHAFWLDKTEHGNWPFIVDDHATEGFYRFATEPTVADLDDDGHSEVIFASWVEKGTYETGRLYIVDYLGNLLREVELPPAYGGVDWNGVLAAPTLDNIDADADLEVVLNTAHSGCVAYDLPGTSNATVQWGTGRGNYRRDGCIPPFDYLYLPLIRK